MKAKGYLCVGWTHIWTVSFDCRWISRAWDYPHGITTWTKQQMKRYYGHIVYGHVVSSCVLILQLLRWKCAYVENKNIFSVSLDFKHTQRLPTFLQRKPRNNKYVSASEEKPCIAGHSWILWDYLCNFISSHTQTPTFTHCSAHMDSAVSHGIPQLPRGVRGSSGRLRGDISDDDERDCGLRDHPGQHNSPSRGEKRWGAHLP